MLALFVSSGVASVPQDCTAFQLLADLQGSAQQLAEKLPDPPEQPSHAILPNGRNNWSSAYTMQSMMFLLQATGEQRWAQELVRWANATLADRNASGPDGKPFAWADHSVNVLHPYVWAGFTGHMFAPLMEFSRYVMEHPDLGDATYLGRTFRDYATDYMSEFSRALNVHLSELYDDGRYAYFRFAKPVPVTDQRLNGQPLPVNMNAALFTAILHFLKAQSAAAGGRIDRRLEASLRHFVAYFNDRVLTQSQCGPVICSSWKYATYMSRAEDIGHSNLVVKFLYDAHASGLDVSESVLVTIGNTIQRLMGDDGGFRANLFDATRMPGVAEAVYYIILLAKYSPALKVKIEPVISRSHNFAYFGPWLQIWR
jgi:hypothetical protein